MPNWVLNLKHKFHMLKVCHKLKIFDRSYNTKEKWPRQVLSAIQPTGKIHLGNYLGAIKKWTDLQNSEKNPVIFGIADLHSITLPKEPTELQNNILTTAASLLACGIDPDRSILFQQSAVKEHTQLCWILTTMTTLAKLTHLPQFKEKSELLKEIYTGIFLYPVLQAADIMLYKASHIPVGEDQAQHIDLVNHLTKLFNNRYGETFPKVETLVDLNAGRIKSLTNPSKKMSKSDKNTKSFISLLDNPEEIIVKCKKALTDFKSEITFDQQNRLGVSNLIIIHSSLCGKTPQEIVEECKHMNTGKYKVHLAELIIENLKPIRQKIMEYLNSPDYLTAVLQNGSLKAQGIAEKTLADVNNKVGFNIKSLNVNNSQLHSIQSSLQSS